MDDETVVTSGNEKPRWGGPDMARQKEKPNSQRKSKNMGKMLFLRSCLVPRNLEKSKSNLINKNMKLVVHIYWFLGPK